MSGRGLTDQLMTIIPGLILCAACMSAIMAGSHYWEAAEEVDIRQTDSSNLARLDSGQQRQYRTYREHQVAPGTALRWVREEVEMTELKQAIRRHEISLQFALLDGNTNR
jgi:hypothetical protein